MHLTVKLLDCIKYRVFQDGRSLIQVRARAPLSDPRFEMDVIYERLLSPSPSESVRITFRMLDLAFFKMPGLGAGIKIPVQFARGVKGVLRVKKYLRLDQTPPVRETLLRKRLARPHAKKPGWLGVAGPMGLDVKLRFLEYR